jgi:hypothetical protein
MFEPLTFVMANFLVPEEIGTSPQSLLLLLPLVAAISIVYKATKLHTLSAGIFLKEVLVLFVSIVVILIITAIVLLVVAWFITQ